MQVGNTILTLSSISIGLLTIVSQKYYISVFIGTLILVALCSCYAVYEELDQHNSRLKSIEKSINYQKELIELKTKIGVLEKTCK